MRWCGHSQHGLCHTLSLLPRHTWFSLGRQGDPRKCDGALRCWISHWKMRKSLVGGGKWGQHCRWSVAERPTCRVAKTLSCWIVTLLGSLLLTLNDVPSSARALPHPFPEGPSELELTPTGAWELAWRVVEPLAILAYTSCEASSHAHTHLAWQRSVR